MLTMLDPTYQENSGPKAIIAKEKGDWFILLGKCFSLCGLCKDYQQIVCTNGSFLYSLLQLARDLYLSILESIPLKLLDYCHLYAYIG
jgi:hypothetical protein